VFRFEISLEDLQNGEDVATCPACTLVLKVIYDEEDFQPDNEETAAGMEKVKRKEPENTLKKVT